MPTSAAITIPLAIRGRFLILLRARKICEAVALLPENIRKRFTSNPCNTTGTATPNVTIRTFTEKTIIAGLDELHTSYTLIKIYAWILIFTSVFGILGNSIVIATYIKRFKRSPGQSPWHFIFRQIGGPQKLYLHLAACDLVFAVLQTVLIFPSVNLSRWPYGIPVCKMTLGAVLLGSLVAIGTILLISMERYKAISSVEPYIMTTGVSISKLAIIWISAIASVVPFILSLSVGKESGICSTNWENAGMSAVSGKIYNLYLLIIWFMVPCAVITFFNGSTVHHLRKHLESPGLDRSSMSSNAWDNGRKKKVRAVKRLVAVVLVFFICCLPSRIVAVITDFIDTGSLSQVEFFALIYTGELPYPFHVCANPIIYSLLDEKFRNDVRDLFYVCCRKETGLGLIAATSLSPSYILDSVRRTLFRDRYEFENEMSHTDANGKTRRRRSDIPEMGGVQNGIFVVHKPDRSVTFSTSSE